jgi:hypothetical protein
MRELANILLVFLLNLIASTGGPAERPSKGGIAPVEKPPVVAVERAGIPICEAASMPIPAPVPQERDLLLIANARARASRNAANAPMAQRGEEKKPRVRRVLIRRVSLL